MKNEYKVVCKNRMQYNKKLTKKEAEELRNNPLIETVTEIIYQPNEAQRGYLVAIAKTATAAGLKPWDELLADKVEYNVALSFDELKDLRTAGLLADRGGAYFDRHYSHKSFTRITKKAYEMIKNEIGGN